MFLDFVISLCFFLWGGAGGGKGVGFWVIGFHSPFAGFLRFSLRTTPRKGATEKGIYPNACTGGKHGPSLQFSTA